MTRRARMLLDALEDGCETRAEIFQHQGSFSLLNNSAAELRAAGIGVVCELVDGDYHYRLLDQGHDDYGAVFSPDAAVALIEEPGTGQLAMVA